MGTRGVRQRSDARSAACQTLAAASPSERRLVFGEVAELYDAARPTYPDALVDDLVGWARGGSPAGAGSALEVGAGTGKATRLLAARGVAVVAVEPAAQMAAVAPRTTAESMVEVIESDFEHAPLDGRRFPLVYAAQAWHWVSQPRGDEPAEASVFRGQDWAAELAGVSGFTDPEVRAYEWSIDYTAHAYADLLSTISEVRMLADDAARARFLQAVREAIAGHGGAFTLAMQTRTWIARAV